jgi:O-antigen ligase
VALALLLLFDGSIVASGSRGALVAGFVALFVLAMLAPLGVRARLALVVGIAALASFSILATQLPQATGKFVAAPSGSAAASAAPAKGYVNAEQKLPLSFDIGTTLQGGAPGYGHGLFGSSGRSVAWRGALDAADARPAVGYGFGTEARVFVDRYALFEGGSAENSYIGLDLQLGAVGLALFLALVATAVVATLRARALPTAGVCLAVVAAGLTVAAVQSYVYSVGDIGTATFWVSAFLGTALLPRAQLST